VLAAGGAKLENGGMLTIVGPNSRFCHDKCVDDCPHVSVFSDWSRADFVEAISSLKVLGKEMLLPAVNP
jgi:hypothetical protein